MLFSYFCDRCGVRQFIRLSCSGGLFVVHISKLYFLIKYDPCFTVTIWKNPSSFSTLDFENSTVLLCFNKVCCVVCY